MSASPFFFLPFLPLFLFSRVYRSRRRRQAGRGWQSWRVEAAGRAARGPASGGDEASAVDRARGGMATAVAELGMGWRRRRRSSGRGWGGRRRSSGRGWQRQRLATTTLTTTMAAARDDARRRMKSNRQRHLETTMRGRTTMATTIDLCGDPGKREIEGGAMWGPRHN